jgi:signal transduction histidine kinase
MRAVIDRAQRVVVRVQAALADPVRTGQIIFFASVASLIVARLTVYFSWDSDRPLAAVVVNAASAALILAAGTILLTIALRRLSLRATVVLLAIQAGITWLPLLPGPVQQSWISIGGLLAASILVGLPSRLRWPLYLLTCVGDIVLTKLALPHTAGSALGMVFLTDLNVGLSAFAIRRLVDLVERARDAQRELIPFELARDQQRITRTLRAALGSTMTTIIRGTDRVISMLHADPDAARRELAELIEHARGALESARHTNSGLRPLTLAHELEAARDVLAAAGIDLTLSRIPSTDGLQVPQAVDAVLALALRRTTMTLVRHQPASVCHISIPGPGQLTITMAGDIPPVVRDELHDELSQIAARATRLNGELSTPADAGMPLLMVRMPVGRPHARLAGAGQAAPRPTDASARLARALLVFTVLDYVAVGAANRLVYQGGHWQLAGPLFALTIPLAIFAGWPRESLRPSRSRDAALIGLGIVAVVGFLFCGPSTVYIPRIFFTGLLANRLRPHRPWLPALAFAIVTYFFLTAEWPTESAHLYQALATITTTIVVYACAQLPPAKAHLDATRGELARLAVSRERQRVGRDVHDMVGLHLSAYILQGELADRCWTTQADMAHTHLTRMAALASKAQADIEAIISEPLDLSTHDELHNTTAVLTASGIQVELEDHTRHGIATVDPTGGLLGVVLREATTNVLRHASARHARIELLSTEGQVRLRVTNDGAQAVQDRTGTGLANLTSRITAAGGTLDAQPDGNGWFTLTATIPMAAAALSTSALA